MKEKLRQSSFIEEALEALSGGTRFGRGKGPLARQTALCNSYTFFYVSPHPPPRRNPESTQRPSEENKGTGM
jgi:hypothetical protein